jgi:tetratricopeptide (TPR) repeat protein
MEISRLILSLVPNPLIITPLILLPIIPYTVHHFHCNHRNYYFAHDLAVGLLKNLDENAALFIKGDVNGFPVWYLHYVENKRKDVALIDTPFLFQDWYAEDIKYKYRDLEFDLYPKHGIELGKARFDDILIKNFDKRPFYQYSDEPIPKGFTTIPVWFFLKILKSGTPKAIVLKELEKGAAEIILRGINDPNVSKDAKANDIIRNCAGGYNNRGNNYLSMGMYDNAIEELKKSANIDPNLPVVYYNLGRAYSNKNMPQAAILNFKKAIELNPNFKDLHRRIGLLYESMGKIDEAIYEYLQEAKISPSVEIYNTLARLYYEKKQINKVIEQCQNILQLDPNNYEARKNLASLYLTQNRLQEAQTEFNILLSKYPNDTYAKNMLRVIQNKIP